MYDDAYTRNENDELAVRTVSTSGDTSTNINDVFTRDENGKLCLRVTGSGGGDQHNKGYFATQSALEEAYPTGEAGDYAIVGSTDTVWLWDEDTSAWIDSDQKGQVTSVNGQTGAVTVSEVPSQTGYSGRVLGTDGFVAGWVVPEKVQRSTMPQADENEVGNIYQFTGTTDANYTNGYFYKCVSDGQDPATYSWTRVDVQPAPVIPDPLPSQTGNSGKFLTTDGTDASWSDKPLTNWAKGIDSFVIGYSSNYVYENATGTQNNTIINGTTNINVKYSVAVGQGAAANRSNCVVIGRSATCNGQYGIAIGNQAGIGMNKDYAIQLGYNQTNGDSNTFKVGNQNGNFEIMSADGTIPADRLTHAINKYSTMPTAASTNEGWIIQFTGTTDSTYTHGHLYECVSDGADPATYSWTEVSLGGASYTAGTGIDITSGVISVADPVLVNTATGNYSVAILNGQATAYGGTSYGNGARANKDFSTTIGYGARAGATNTIQISAVQSVVTNSDANTFKVANANGNYEIMSADGTVPTARLTKVNTTATLAVADWSSSTQTVTVSGVKADSVVFVSPDPTSASDYASAGILCTAQAADSLTFTCTTTPTSAITVNIVCL